jgi:exopolyphosphatase/guanosine-5'-triphosphate,3'-diphosphate pyrophosphatase
MSELIGVIDIGTYSTRLLIVGIHWKDNPKDTINSIQEVLSVGRITALGRNVKETGYLQKEAMEETLAVLKEYVAIAKQYKVSKLIGFATEACRIAKNGEEFLKRVESLGIDVNLIDGDKEAYLSFMATAFSLYPEGSFLVIDQGGGSTEYALGQKEDENYKLVFSKSLPFGIVNLTERFFLHDPPKKREIKEMKNYLTEQINSIKEYIGNPDSLIGLGGTITTLVALEKNIYPYVSSKVHGQKLTLEAIKKWFNKLVSIPTIERQKFPQIEDKRAKVLPSGILIFLTTLEVFNKKEIIISDRGLRYGAVIDYILKKFNY